VETQHPLGVLRETSGASAAVIVPILVDLIHPDSVLDVGCGDGAWLRAFAPIPGVGIDVHDPTDVPDVDYRQQDLTKPFDVGTFDLAISLEVAEHLPASAAPTFVESLTRAAPVVAFSAARPGQDGHLHINCQWPSYWRTLFAAQGYDQFDVLRARIWDDARIAPWYRQNMFLYAKDRTFAGEGPRDVVHPEALTPPQRGLAKLLREIPAAVHASIAHRRH
jgi:SAM-dependent methyltransferase